MNVSLMLILNNYIHLVDKAALICDFDVPCLEKTIYTKREREKERERERKGVGDKSAKFSEK